MFYTILNHFTFIILDYSIFLKNVYFDDGVYLYIIIRLIIEYNKKQFILLLIYIVTFFVPTENTLCLTVLYYFENFIVIII